MKKGVFSLVVSFVLGLAWLFYYFAEHHVPYMTKTFAFFSRTIDLPSVTLPAFIIVSILAVFVNLVALFAATPSLAMGAAVFYGMAIGFNPDCYPYVIVEFIFCVIATVRMRERKEETAGDLSDQLSGRKRKSSASEPAYIHHYADSPSSAQAEMSSRAYRSKNNAAAKEMEAQKRAAAKAMGSSSAGVQSSTYEALRAQEKKESFGSGNSGRYAAIIFLAAMIVGAAILIPLAMGVNRSKTATRETSSQPWWMNDLDRYLANSGSSTSDSTTGTSGSTNNDITSDDSSTTVGGSTDDSSNSKSSASTSKTDAMNGLWKTDEAQSSGTTMEAEISDDKISVYWINKDGSKSLYWAGNLKFPDEQDGSFVCMAIRDATKYRNAPFASQETMKQFLFNGDTMKFHLDAAGMTVWIRLQKSDENLSESE